ncbi:MAG: DUF4298 domain-containing protein [Bacilli bacterium]|nr:DUF4298 domain-containing protein [Bacilli bacterium]
MIERINKNEERLNNILLSIKELDNALNTFKNKKKDIYLINKYYESKNWFLDKEKYESNKIKNIKAGVLSEDSVWNMNEDINDLINEMKNIIKEWEQKKD